MATKTLGTVANNTLTAVPFSYSLSDADVATISQAIVADTGPSGAPVNSGYTFPGSFSRVGFLYVPNRGKLLVLPGDWIGVDPNTGWPILLSAGAAAGAGFAHS